jgi:DNA polymerase elongation subunit (family B)
VEGVLIRALHSLNSDERGSKQGRHRQSQNISGGEALTADTKSQTQSPWKARRQADDHCHENDSEAQSPQQLSDRRYFFFSPSLQDTTRQEALEAQALTLEPQSGHQRDPVVVCDFTALYPALVIAYNLCYSTCGGKLDYHSTRNEMRQEGRTTGKVGPMQYFERMTAYVLIHHLKSLSDENLGYKDRVYATPTGAIFVSETIVKGVLPQVLDEMLSTRAMLKKAAKQYKKHVPDISPSILR